MPFDLDIRGLIMAWKGNIMTLDYSQAGDKALLVSAGDRVDVEVNGHVRGLMFALEERAIPGVEEIIPAYCTLLITYDPMTISSNALQVKVKGIDTGIAPLTSDNRRVVQIPTLYGGEYGPDLVYVSEHAELSEEEVIQTHSGTDYLVFMLGFTPGFPYLGELPVALFTPRLDTPRKNIPAGSVGIAEGQTGVYPISGPGGWRLIGRTPLRFFDTNRETPSLLYPGDYVRFVAIADEYEYLEIQRSIDAGENTFNDFQVG